MQCKQSPLTKSFWLSKFGIPNPKILNLVSDLNFCLYYPLKWCQIMQSVWHHNIVHAPLLFFPSYYSQPKDLIFLKFSEFMLPDSYSSKLNNKNPNMLKMFKVTWSDLKSWSHKKDIKIMRVAWPKQWQLIGQNDDNWCLSC